MKIFLILKKIFLRFRTSFGFRISNLSPVHVILPPVRLLALDIGTRRTGMAFADSSIGIPHPLETIHHSSSEELIAAVQRVCEEKKIDQLVIGLPLLPSGDEGEQAQYVRTTSEQLKPLGLPMTFLDERYSSPRPLSTASSSEDRQARKEVDPDASAASQLAQVFLDKMAFDNN